MSNRNDRVYEEFDIRFTNNNGYPRRFLSILASLTCLQYRNKWRGGNWKRHWSGKDKREKKISKCFNRFPRRGKTKNSSWKLSLPWLAKSDFFSSIKFRVLVQSFLFHFKILDTCLLYSVLLLYRDIRFWSFLEIEWIEIAAVDVIFKPCFRL